MPSDPPDEDPGQPGIPENAPPLEPPPTPVPDFGPSPHPGLPTSGTPLLARRSNPLINMLLFGTTLLSTTYWGFLQYQNYYIAELGGFFTFNPIAAPAALLGGLPFGVAVIAFLLTHEMGHYLACRYYGIQATLPYFIPIIPLGPFLMAPGTMGAVIRIVSPITSRRALFDIAVAGPIAGFIIALPILAVGLTQSRVLQPFEMEQLGGLYFEMGEPPIWAPMQLLFAPTMASDAELWTHPLAYVGWFALLVTAMNLLPVGQLDGGHILYALFPRAHRWSGRLVLLGMIAAGFWVFPGWLVFALVVALLIGTRHPRPIRFDQPLGRGRALLALIAALILAGCFMLEPLKLQFG